MSGDVFLSVPQECMGQLIGTKGRNIKEVAQLTQTKIYTCNGNNLGRKCGFRITGSPYACEAACAEINRRIDNLAVAIKNPVPQQFARLLISRNVRQIQQECNVKIYWENEKEDVIFCIKGSRVNCERARSMMHTYMEKWKHHDASQRSEASVCQAAPKGDRVRREIKVLKEYVGLVVGIKRKKLGRIETKSETKIIVPKRDVEGQVEEIQFAL